MKKLQKWLVLAMAATMVMGTCLTASAATSTATVSATATEVSAVSATTADGTAVTVSAVTESVVTDAQKAAVSLVGGSAGSVQVEKVFELTASISGPTDITIAVPGVTAGQKVAVLHQKSDGAWESVPVTNVASGSVTATFTSLSPVAIVTYASPKTGEVVSMVAVLALIALAGSALCAAKFARK